MTEQLSDPQADHDQTQDGTVSSVNTVHNGQSSSKKPFTAMKPIAVARKLWRQLTSMKTALLLLFLLAVAAIPGSLLPQRALNPIKVDRYLTQHRTIGPLLDKASFFDVFAAPWFAAIYLLLMISLLGCLIPRLMVYLQNLRKPPPEAPRRLERFPESANYEAAISPAEIADDAAQLLRSRRWRVRVSKDGSAAAVSAEKGYLQETGNLIFHLAVVVILIGLAVGKLWGYQGSVLVEEGHGFCNAVLQYDSFRPGRLTKGSSPAPFCVQVDKFSTKYEADGTAAEFRADIHYNNNDTNDHSYPLKVNSPLRIDGASLYLVGHGYSPIFTVKTSSGQVFNSISAPFIPQDNNFTSEGAIKLPDAAPKQLAIDGLFAPAAVMTAPGVVVSASPQAFNPVAAIFVYQGNLGIDSGKPQSVYTIDQQQIKRGDLKKVSSANLVPGDTLKITDGTQITFNGYHQWANLQVNRDPGKTVVLVGAVLLLIGLLLSFSIRRRRFWLRATENSDSSAPTSVSVGGLARSEAGGFSAEFGRLISALKPAAQPTAATVGKEGESSDGK